MVYCLVKTCDNGFGKKSTKGIKFHKFPKNPEIRKLWIDAVKVTSENKFPSSSSRICSEHFKDECYFESGWLNSEAVPTIFPKIIESKELPIMPEIQVPSVEIKQNLENQCPNLIHDAKKLVKTNALPALPDFPEAHCSYVSHFGYSTTLNETVGNILKVIFTLIFLKTRQAIKEITDRILKEK